MRDNLVSVEVSRGNSDIELKHYGFFGETNEKLLSVSKSDRENIPVRFPVTGPHSLTLTNRSNSDNCAFLLEEGANVRKKNIYIARNYVPFSCFRTLLVDSDTDLKPGLRSVYLENGNSLTIRKREVIKCLFGLLNKRAARPIMTEVSSIELAYLYSIRVYPLSQLSYLPCHPDDLLIELNTITRKRTNGSWLSDLKRRQRTTIAFCRSTSFLEEVEGERISGRERLSDSINKIWHI